MFIWIHSFTPLPAPWKPTVVWFQYIHSDTWELWWKKIFRLSPAGISGITRVLYSCNKRGLQSRPEGEGWNKNAVKRRWGLVAALLRLMKECVIMEVVVLLTGKRFIEMISTGSDEEREKKRRASRFLCALKSSRTSRNTCRQGSGSLTLASQDVWLRDRGEMTIVKD